MKKKNYYFYEERTLHDSSLSKSTHCVLAADLGEQDVAYRFFKGCGEIDLGSTMTTSDMGVHTASMGGIWQCAVYGFGGVRAVGETLRVEPRLPQNWSALRFLLVWRGQPLDISIQDGEISVHNQGRDTISLLLYGESCTVNAGETLRRALH